MDSECNGYEYIQISFFELIQLRNDFWENIEEIDYKCFQDFCYNHRKIDFYYKDELYYRIGIKDKNFDFKIEERLYWIPNQDFFDLKETEIQTFQTELNNLKIKYLKE